MTKKSRPFLAGMFGNTLEWFDFTLYAYFAVIFSELFFPVENENLALIATFGVFALGFLVRPLGGLVIGHWGDKLGRKKAMLITMFLITASTLLTATLPTYQQIGLMAPLLLTLARVAQGFAISGEFNTTTAFLTEHVKGNRRGFAGSLVMCSAFFGMLLGALTVALMLTVFDKDTLMNGAWRIPYIFGGILGVIGIFMRLRVKETTHFAELNMNNRKANAPIKILLREHKKTLCKVICLASGMSVGNYLLIAYFPTFLTQQYFSLEMAMWINSTNMMIFMLLLPVFGLLSDKYGRKPVFSIGICSTILVAIPAFWLLGQSSVLMVFLGELLFVVCFAPIAALVPTITAELFPTHIRSSGSAIGYNISLAIFGGTTPLVAFTLVEVTNTAMAPAGYLILAACLSLVAIVKLAETAHKSLQQLHKPVAVERLW